MAIVSESELKQKINSFTQDDWRALLSIRSQVAEATEFTTVSENGKYFVWTDVVKEFHSIVYAMPVVVSFDWPAWELGKRALNDEAHGYGDYDLETLCKLITTIVRAERFSEGFLPAKFADGSILKILDAIASRIES